MQKLVLIKLGGSVITFKEKPLAANLKVIEDIARVLGQLDIPAIIVHGGGSFGHYWSVKYDMHTKQASYDAHGISIVHESMIGLNQIIVNAMIRAGLNPYGVAPLAFVRGQSPILTKIKQIHAMAKSNVIPVTFGDVVHMQGNQYSILSGDALMTILARVLHPSAVIFATNVDGIYRDMIGRELVSEIRTKDRKSMEFSSSPGTDVTGGMRRKIAEAFKIASNGVDVLLVNGLMPERIRDAVQGNLQVGTTIRRGGR